MPVAQPHQEAVDHSAAQAKRFAGEASARAGENPAAARLADDLAVPAPSPVHRLQDSLAQLIMPEEVPADVLYPGWFRLAFPIASSLLLWAGILWGVGIFG
ncbi:MAG: hypothetical protein ACKVOL_10675 [Novosphingobium sp.]